MAMAELDELENRFKLRIEHWSTLPFPSRFSDRLRNTRHELDHANFMRTNNYYFVNNQTQNHGSSHTLELDNFQVSRSNMIENFNAADANIQLALLQNFLMGQNQLGLSMNIGTNYSNNDSYQTQFQLPNHNHPTNFASTRGTSVFEAQQRV